MNDIRQTAQYVKYLKKTGWSVENHAGNYYFIKSFPLLGSFVKIQRPSEVNTSIVETVAKKHRAFQVVVEPKDELSAKHLFIKGFKKSNNPYLPTKTLQLILTKSEAEIVAGFKKDVRYALKKEGGVKETEDIGVFRKSWQKAVKRKLYVPKQRNLAALKSAFTKDALFLLSKSTNSGAIFLLADKIAYYWQAFTDRAGRKELSQYQILWEGIRWAKRKGAKIFDFEGIYDDRFPKKAWLGFSHFKKSFGGDEVLLPGCYTKLMIF